MAGPHKSGKDTRKLNENVNADDSSRVRDDPPRPAAQDRSRGHYHTKKGEPVSDVKSEMELLMQRAEATMTLATAWSENFTRLVHLEFQRTLGAGKRIVVLGLFLFFLAIALLVSLCAGLGLLSFYFTQSVYIGFGVFLLSQILIVAGLLLSINSLRKLLGFEESKKQAREALDDVTALFKQAD